MSRLPHQEISMEYMLLIHSDDSGFAALPPEAQAKGMASYGA